MPRLAFTPLDRDRTAGPLPRHFAASLREVSGVLRLRRARAGERAPARASAAAARRRRAAFVDQIRGKCREGAHGGARARAVGAAGAAVPCAHRVERRLLDAPLLQPRRLGGRNRTGQGPLEPGAGDLLDAVKHAELDEPVPLEPRVLRERRD